MKTANRNKKKLCTMDSNNNNNKNETTTMLKNFGKTQASRRLTQL